LTKPMIVMQQDPAVPMIGRSKLGWIAFGLLTVTACILCAGWLYRAAKRAEPQYSGQLQLPGLAQEVRIEYGPHAVPSLHAQSLDDLFFAQGYVVASERMWQMDLLRRISRGRLSEWLGERTLPIDRMFRTLGTGRAAEAGVEALPPRVLAWLQAYVRGVNAYRLRSADRPPLEYRLLGVRPEPWTPADSLAVAEYMAFVLSFNAKEELVFLRLARRLGADRARELFPGDEGVPAPRDGIGLPETGVEGALLEAIDDYAVFASRHGLPVPGPASNAWALSGERTADGFPLLANDPHLAASMPSIWYELELIAPQLHVAGLALPGVPMVVIGHNPDLAWGVTAALADTQDIVVERLAEDGRGVMRPGGAVEPLRVRREAIRVRGRERPYELTLRSTRHGVVLNGMLGERRGLPLDFVTLSSSPLLALAWNLERPDGALEALYRLNTATDLGAARRAVQGFGHVANTFLLAHRDGDIAWQTSGALPRRAGYSGNFPMPGWEGDTGWQGYHPAASNPGGAQPASGVLVAANHRPLPPESARIMGQSWMAPYRAQRIRSLLAAKPRFSAADLARQQRDTVSLEARHYQQALRNLAPQLQHVAPRAWQLAERILLAWDGDMAPDSEAAALFVLLRRSLFEELFGDELGGDLEALASLYLVTYNPLQEAVRSGRSSFWDDTRTPERETPARIWGRAIRRAGEELEAGGWGRLDRLQRLVFPHAFHRLPVLGAWLDVGPVGVGGGDFTLNVMKSELFQPQRPLFIPTYRVVMTPGDWLATRGSQPLGQSGHRFSPYRADQLADWLRGGGHAWPWNGPAGGEVLGVLHLLPRIDSGTRLP
jgi:penicillin amidase